MGRIDVTPEQVAATGRDVVSVGTALAALRGAASGLAGAASEPAETAAALEGLATEWAAGAERLGDDLTAMGELTEVSSVLYRDTDGTAMGGSDPAMSPP